MLDHQLSFPRSCLWILMSTLFISGTGLMIGLYYLHIKERHFHDDQYRIVAIVQKLPQGEALKNVYLAEQLDLTLDQPMNLYQFNLKEAEQKLLASPLIKSVKVKKILPGTLYVDYQMRVPVAYLGDYTNTALDEEGYLFPFRPFFTPKRLPILYLGLEQPCQWGQCLKEHSALQSALAILQEFHKGETNQLYIKQLDVSKIQANSYGERQIVLMLEKRSQEWDAPQAAIFLRLGVDHYIQDLMNFQVLQKSSFFLERKTLDHALVIDFRLPQLAFLKEIL
jgi:hypothetical protein